MKDFQVNDNQVIFSTGEIVKFEFSIKQNIMYNNMMIVLLFIPSEIVYNRNVFALSETGQIIWQIEKLEQSYFQGHCPFNEVIVDGLNLIIFNWCDHRFNINPQNGEVISSVSVK